MEDLTELSCEANRALIDYLVYSCAYYIYGESLVSDREFDELASKLSSLKDQVTHPHKHLID